jgi:hypothetical protein
MKKETDPKTPTPPVDERPMTFDTIDWQGNKTLESVPSHPQATPETPKK